jgi:hypothetical protein
MIILVSKFAFKWVNVLSCYDAAAFAVGDTGLAEKFKAGAESLRHGVVFAASLYL